MQALARVWRDGQKKDCTSSFSSRLSSSLVNRDKREVDCFSGCRHDVLTTRNTHRLCLPFRRDGNGRGEECVFSSSSSFPMSSHTFSRLLTSTPSLFPTRSLPTSSTQAESLVLHRRRSRGHRASLLRRQLEAVVPVQGEGLRGASTLPLHSSCR
jgi:hypothetical protein